jgi:hypothetical protein
MDNTDPDRKVVEEKVISTCRNIAELLQWLQRTVGLTYFSVYIPHGSTLCAYTLLEFLDRPAVPAIFHTMIVALSNSARRWTITRGILKMIWITLQERRLDASLDAATLSLFKLNAVDNWGPQDHRLFEMCAYPNYAAIETRGRDFVEMGELLQEYAGLQLDDKTPKEASH